MFVYALPAPHQQLTLTDGIKSAHLTFSDDPAALKTALQRIAPVFKKEAVGARPTSAPDKTVAIVPGSFARALNVPDTAQRLRDALKKDPTARRFTVVLDKTPPDLTAEKLQGVTGILGRFTTHSSAQTKRNQNIAIAVESIDGTLLSPGETFSINDTIGRRTQARGYRTATVFVDAKLVPGVGGGVSQVTGTLFNAAALAGIRIKEANPHSRPVSYLPLGRDATVAFGDKDLRFTNTTGKPIYIGYSFVKKTLQATLWGAVVSGRTVTLTPVVDRRGPGHIDAELYRTIKQDGKVIQKERLLRHTYRWKPK